MGPINWLGNLPMNPLAFVLGTLAYGIISHDTPSYALSLARLVCDMIY